MHKRGVFRIVGRAFLTTIGITVITGGLLVLLEGIASTMFVAQEIARNVGRDRNPMRLEMPDTLVGWISQPGFRDDRLYGADGGAVINGQSMRDTAEALVSEPGLLRVVCSGDSFTFGLGVGNEDTWCARIERFDARIRTLNLGTLGYGVDQAYLRYRRDAERLEHAVHIFAFIPHDIRRARLARFNGYPKPYFSVRADGLELRNVPVPRLSRVGAMIVRHRERLRDLNILRLADRVASRLRGSQQTDYVNSEEQATRIAVQLMDSVAASAREHGRLTVFVLLEERFTGNQQYDDLAATLAVELARRGLILVDLRAEARALPADSLESIFSRNWGHYTVQGNEWVAERLWLKLNAMPEFKQRLNEWNLSKPRETVAG
jgi:hypothetical protein